MKKISVIGILALSMVAGVAGASEHEKRLSTLLRQVVENNLAAYNREDVSTTMRSVHTKSPEYGKMQQTLPNQFGAMDARAELVRFHFIGHDDEFAVARVELKTVDQSGEPFVPNILDTMTVFHQEDGIWKYWSTHVLGVQLVQKSKP